MPIHTPTAQAGASGFRGGARYPYVERSRASFAVPVLTAAGRRLPCGPLNSASFSAQIGFCFASVLPARMLVTRKAVDADTARERASGGAFQTTLPARSRISRIIRGGSCTPPSASVPNADTRSSGRTSTVPIAPARPACRNAFLPPANRRPIRSAVSATAWLPTRWSVRIAGMLSDIWSAFRTRTGPRSSWSASRGAQRARGANVVVMSRSREPGVSFLRSNAVAYRTGLKAEPGWRVPSPAASNLGLNRREARSSR